MSLVHKGIISLCGTTFLTMVVLVARIAADFESKQPINVKIEIEGLLIFGILGH